MDGACRTYGPASTPMSGFPSNARVLSSIAFVPFQREFRHLKRID